MKKTFELKNPILKGFNPDPSFIFVDGTYYIATSTFEYNPGVTIHYSDDLVHWKSVGVLKEKRLLNLTGIPHSGGIWAPCLNYNLKEGLFYLVYTNFKSSYTPPFRDQDNYLVTSPSIFGPWSDPVYLNSSGYDPFVFFDDDGKKYICNMLWDYRQISEKQSAGIILQEYSDASQALVGEAKVIFEGTEIGQTEGPNIYKRNGWYYLMTAEGGPHYEHRVTLCRSRNIWGPYEIHPDQYILMGHGSLQKAGHASICRNDEGKWYIAYLCSRPLANKRCTMGRETAIQEVLWREDDWLYLANGGNHPDEILTVRSSDEMDVASESKKYTFTDDEFLEDFLTLREPWDNGRFELTDNKLRMYGRESINSRIEQSLIVRRQTSVAFEAIAELVFEPENFGQMAGLIYRYDEAHQYYCYMTFDEERNYLIRSLAIDGFHYDLLPAEQSVAVNSNHVFIKVSVAGEEGAFYCSEDGENWSQAGNAFDASKLSDDYAIGFTAAMVGMACQDLISHRHPADFLSFEYTDTTENL